MYFATNISLNHQMVKRTLITIWGCSTVRICFFLTRANLCRNDLSDQYLYAGIFIFFIRGHWFESIPALKVNMWLFCDLCQINWWSHLNVVMHMAVSQNKQEDSIALNGLSIGALKHNFSKEETIRQAKLHRERSTVIQQSQILYRPSVQLY